MTSPSKYTRPTRLEGLTAFIAHYVAEHSKLLDVLAEKVSSRLAPAYVVHPSALQEPFEIECRVKDAHHAYLRDFGRDLNVDLEAALSAWVVEAFYIERQPSVRCVATLHAGRYLQVAVGVDYLSKPSESERADTAAAC